LKPKNFENNTIIIYSNNNYTPNKNPTLNKKTSRKNKIFFSRKKNIAFSVPVLVPPEECLPPPSPGYHPGQKEGSGQEALKSRLLGLQVESIAYLAMERLGRVSLPLLLVIHGPLCLCQCFFELFFQGNWSSQYERYEWISSPPLLLQC